MELQWGAGGSTNTVVSSVLASKKKSSVVKQMFFCRQWTKRSLPTLLINKGQRAQCGTNPESQCFLLIHHAPYDPHQNVFSSWFPHLYYSVKNASFYSVVSPIIKMRMLPSVMEKKLKQK